MECLKLLVLGDGAVGKSCLLIRYATDTFPSGYVPTVFDNYVADVTVDGKPISVGLWDTAGQEDYDRLRPLSYPNTDVFFLCFALDNPDSLENIEERWFPEVTHYCPDVPKVIVGCKKDLCGDGSSKRPDSCVSYEQGSALAKKLGIPYFETSALVDEGVKSTFDDALRHAMTADRTSKSKKKGFGFGFGLFGKKNDAPQPPVMPPAGKAPWIEIETSQFAENWSGMLQNPQHSDVTFIVEGKHHLNAHKIILSATSKFFHRVLGVHESVEGNQLKQRENDSLLSRDEVNEGKVPGISLIYDEVDAENKQAKTVIELSEDIKGKIFVHVLEFLYAGIPTFKDDTTEEDLDNLVNVSRIMDLPYLETICDNQRTEQDFLNPSIGTYLNDECGKVLKKRFLNNSTLSDISFRIANDRIYAHKAILAARCDVMSAMFSGHFAEGISSSEVEITDISCENFMALLEYLYTDHAPIEESDSVGILVVANQFCQPRLVNMCELYITKEVDKSCSKQIEKSDIDVIGLLLTAQFYNASQLDNWCLHFISTNFMAFKKRSEFEMLKDDNLRYVEEHQWPPLSYLKEVEDYEKLMRKKGVKCPIM